MKYFIVYYYIYGNKNLKTFPSERIEIIGGQNLQCVKVLNML